VEHPTRESPAVTGTVIAAGCSTTDPLSPR
jgi:hypothetical protein